MQSLVRKFPLNLIIFFLAQSQLLFSQELDEKVNLGDSLFKSRKYTQAFSVYDDLYKNDRLFSPQMLVKMAFIQEARGNYAQTLHYLNHYYLLSNDKKAREKMEDLATQYSLQGYEYSDFKFILNLARYYQIPINFLFILFVSIWVVWIAYRSFWYKSNMKFPALMVLLLLVAFQVLNFVIKSYSEAIISTTTFVMTGPSAAADIYQTIEKGNKVVVLDETDVWYKVSLDERKGYIKKNHLLLITP